MVFEDWRFPKSKEILQESHIKIGPKRVCKNEAKVSQKGAKVGARNRQFFEKYPKKGVPKIDAKKGRICEAPKSDYDSNAWGRVAHSGPAGRDLGRGTVTCLLVLRWISIYLKTLCSPVGAADLLIHNGDMGLPGSTYPLIFEVLVRCQKIMVFWSLPDRPTNPKNLAMERPMVENVDSALQRGVRFGAKGSLLMKRKIVYWRLNRLSHTPRGLKARRILLVVSRFLAMIINLRFYNVFGVLASEN